MKFSINNDLFKIFPDYRVGLLVITGIDNQKSLSESFSFLRNEVTALQNKSLVDADTIPELNEWIKAFTKADIDPTQYRPSALALIQRVIAKQDIPNINPITNLLNGLSIKHKVSIGGHDLDKTVGDICVEKIHRDFPFCEMGQTQPNAFTDEVVYRDSEEILTRNWIWRQGEKSKTNLNTQNILIPIDVLGFITDSELDNIILDVEQTVISNLGGKSSRFIITNNSNSISIPPLFISTKAGKADPIEELLTRGVEQIYPNKKELEKVLRSGKKLKLYQGFDPSMPSLHLGNFVGLMKLRQFQQLGHEVIFLVGDFTGMIGDPTDKKATRQPLTREQTRSNCQSWVEQAGRILNFSGDNPVSIKYNSEWLDTITFKDLIGITANFTVQQMIERDMFQERLKAAKPIHLHEFLYPIAQGMDSVFMDVDLEIAGSDQLFNMLAGRTLMKALKNKDKYVLTTKLLVDAKGDKVGKTTGNALFLDSAPKDFYGGIMSFPDEVIALGFELLTELPWQGLDKQIANDPMGEKKRLAFAVIKLLWGEQSAMQAQDHFENVYQKGEMPKDLPVREVGKGEWDAGKLLVEVGLATSQSEAKRLIQQKAVELNGLLITDHRSLITVGTGDILKVGKTRYVKLLSS